MKEGIVDVLDSWLDSRLRNVHTCIPGKIEAYYGHSQRKAKVKPLIKLITKKGNVLQIPPIDNVPVIFPSSQDFSMLFNLKKGDGCLILFSEEPIGDFLNGLVEVTSTSLARFALSDAVCLPGLWSFPSSPNENTQARIKVENSNKMSIETVGGSVIDLDGSNVNINNGSKGVARKDDATVIDSTTDSTFMTFLQTHTHSGVTTGPGVSGPPVPPTPTSIDGKINEGSDSVKVGD